MSQVSKDIAERLNEFRLALIGQQRRLLQQVAHLEGDLRWFDENVESEVVEEGQERSIASVLELLDEQERAEIEAIERALERIDSGTYGVCVVCGEPIALARQRAVPMAETCVTCTATRQEPKRG